MMRGFRIGPRSLFRVSSVPFSLDDGGGVMKRRLLCELLCGACNFRSPPRVALSLHLALRFLP